MTVSEKLKAIEAAINAANIKFARMLDDADWYEPDLLTVRTLQEIARHSQNVSAVTAAQKNAKPLSNEIGTHLPKSIKNVWSNFKRERGIQPADSDYGFHFCDTLPNGHDLTDDELGWPNGIPIAFNGSNDLVMVMPDLSYCKTGMAIADFPFMENTDLCNYLVNPTRYIIYYSKGNSQYLYISERLYEWKCLDISALKVMDNQICCDHNGIIYILCTGDLIRIIDPDKYTYTNNENSSDLMIIHTVAIKDVITQDVNQLRENTQNVSIIVGSSGTILRSTDDGLTWSKITVSGITSSLSDISYSNNTWIAVGQSGTILRSTDNGLTWTKITIGVSSDLRAIYYSNHTWIIVGMSSTILRSTDDGLTWTKINIGAGDNLYCIHYANNTWITSGSYYIALHSIDDGLTWTKIKIERFGVFSGICYANNVWIMVGTGSSILRSTDNGLTWTQISVSGVTSDLYRIRYVNHTWIIVGSSGTILRSTDDGLTWTKTTVNKVNPQLIQFNGIHYSNNTWIAVGEDGIILHSTDDGLTWNNISVSGVSNNLSRIYCRVFPQFYRYGGEQFRKNYNFAEYFVSTNDNKLLIGGNVLGTSMTEEAGFVGKIEPGTVLKNWDGSDIKPINGSDDTGLMIGGANTGFSVYTEHDAIAIGGQIPYFIINNPMDIGMLGFADSTGEYPGQVLGIQYIDGHLTYNIIIISMLLDIYKVSIWNYMYPKSQPYGIELAPTTDVNTADLYLNTYIPMIPNINKLYYGVRRPTAVSPSPYITRWPGGSCERLIISQDTIEVSPGRHLMLEIDAEASGNIILYITDEVFPVEFKDNKYQVVKDNISARSVPIEYLDRSYFADYLNFSTTSTIKPYQSGVHMVRGGDHVYIWMTTSDNKFLAWVYDLRTGRLASDIEFKTNSWSSITGSVLSISASNTMQTLKRGDSLPPIISNVFITVRNSGVIKYYYLDYKKSQYNNAAYFTEFDPTNKYNATQTVVGTNTRRQIVRFNDKSIYYNHGNVFVRLDYLDPSTTSEEYLGNIKHKYLMCGLNNTAMNLRAIEDTDSRSGSFICTSTKTDVFFTKLNALNKRTSIQNTRNAAEIFTPDIIVLYNLSYDYYDADTDDLSGAQTTTYLSDTQFIAVFKKDEYTLDENQNVSSGNLLVRTGGTAGTRYSMVQGNGGPIDLIVYPDHMEINVSSEFLGTNISYLAIGQRGAPIIK